jgi:predicted dehydrogenase
MTVPPPNRSASEPTRLGIIGCGDVATREYLPWLAEQASARVLACFDTRADRAESAAARFPGAKALTSLDALLAQPGLEAVVNLTPAPFHAEINAAALDAGLDVYSEKPLAGSAAEGRALAERATARGRLLLAAPAMMATARFRWLKSLLASGEIGRPTLITGQFAGMGPAAWRDYSGDPAVFYGPGVGPLVDTGVYLLHAVTGLLGPAKRVHAFGGIAIPERTVLIPSRYGEKITVQTNDQMLIGLDFGDVTFAQLLSSIAVPASKAPAMEIHATGGTVSIGRGPWFNLAAPVDLWVRDERPDAKEQWVEALPPESFGPRLNTLPAGLAHFLAVRAGQENPILTPEHACHVLEIIDLAFQSAKNGATRPTTTVF